MRGPRTILITGASSGLGAALARSYAAPNRTIIIAARRGNELQKVKEDCKKLGADVISKNIDLRNLQEIEDWVSEIFERAPVDLLIANAGTFAGIGDDQRLEASSDIVELIETNVIATISLVNIVAERMKEQTHGHIAVISSLAAIEPMADAPTYSASKAALLAYSDALRQGLADENITISTVLPGHIKTAQTDMHVGRLPGLMSPEKAVDIIKTGLDRGATLIAFPRYLYWLAKLGRLLPWRLRVWANKPLRFHVKTKPDAYAKDN